MKRLHVYLASYYDQDLGSEVVLDHQCFKFDDLGEIPVKVSGKTLSVKE